MWLTALIIAALLAAVFMYEWRTLKTKLMKREKVFICILYSLSTAVALSVYLYLAN